MAYEMLISDGVQTCALPISLQYLKKSKHRDAYGSLEFIGFGALPLFEYLDRQPLASIQEPPYQIGEKAATMLLDLIRNPGVKIPFQRSAEHTYALQSLMRISYAVFCLKNNN